MKRYRLYIKKTPPTPEHLQGYLYLGYTSTEGKSFDRYVGSGKDWIKYLKKYKFTYKDIFTTVIKELYSEEDLRTWGIYYSNLYSIKNRDLWANKKIEEGSGGFLEWVSSHAGKIGGKKNRESGHMSRLGKQTGSIQGKKNVDTGFLLSIAHLGGSKSKDKIWIYKDGKNKRIKDNEKQHYLEDNWIIGRVVPTFTKNHTKETKERLKKINSNTIRITNGKINTTIKKDQTILEGFWKGVTRGLKNNV